MVINVYVEISFYNLRSSRCVNNMSVPVDLSGGWSGKANNKRGT